MSILTIYYLSEIRLNQERIRDMEEKATRKGNGMILDFEQTAKENSELLKELREKYKYDEKRYKRIKKEAKKAKRRYALCNWDSEYYTDLITGNGFDIRSVQTIMDEVSEKVPDYYGPRSPFYGAIHTNTDSYLMRYQCDCGLLHGAANEGRICKLCGSMVIERRSDPKKTGWITLPNDNFIINPYSYEYFKDLLGKKKGADGKDVYVFDEIVHDVRLVNADGEIHSVSGVDIPGTNKSLVSPFVGIGISGFKNQFEEVMDYYKTKYKKNPTKLVKLEQIEQYRSAIFTSHIPVYTPMLRPQALSSDTFYHIEYDKEIINPVIGLCNLLDDCAEIARPRIVEDIQIRVNKMISKNLVRLNGKKGWIQGNIFGGRNNYIARDLIIPDITLKDNEIDLCYITFLEMFQYVIIEHLKRMFGLRHSEAMDIVYNASIDFNEQVYSVIQFMVEEEGVYCVINRNPSLWMKSALRMKVRRVIPDINDYSLVIPFPILPGLNADFDGDIMNNKACVLPEIAYIYRKFDPIRSYITDSVTGKVDKEYLPNKGTLADLIMFANF